MINAAYRALIPPETLYSEVPKEAAAWGKHQCVGAGNLLEANILVFKASKSRTCRNWKLC